MTPTYPRGYGFDVEALLDLFGVGASGIAKELQAQGLPAPAVKTIEQWRTRRSIPVGWLAVLTLCLKHKGRRFSLVRLIVTPDASHG